MALLPLADEQAELLLAALPKQARLECWWLILRDGAPVPGNKGGGVTLFAELPLTRPLALLLRAFRLSPLIDVLDNLLARYRSSLGRFIPDGPALRRYP